MSVTTMLQYQPIDWNRRNAILPAVDNNLGNYFMQLTVQLFISENRASVTNVVSRVHINLHGDEP